jgi:parvulin-like peptidyl-prolyl isomerase
MHIAEPAKMSILEKITQRELDAAAAKHATFLKGIRGGARTIFKFKDLSGLDFKGADFSQMARDRSVAKSAAKGGEVEVFSEAPFPEMGNQLASMEQGGISRVFKGPEGFYLIILDQKTGGEPRSFEEVKEEIITGLTILKQQQALADHIEKLKQKTTVKVNEKFFQ